MGLTALTRYDLFQESSRLIESNENPILYKDPQIIQTLYSDSSILINGFEEIINRDDNIPEKDEYWSLFSRNAEEVSTPGFAREIQRNTQSALEKQKRQYPYQVESFKKFFKYMIKAIIEYQNKIIKENYIEIADYTIQNTKRPQTFLSYAYDDKGLTLSLFYHFLKNDGFLYVNWMFEGTNKTDITKEKIEKALSSSDQLLFLRTLNSEFKGPGNQQFIRQWCAWEIGNFYTKHPNNKFYTSFYEKEATKNDLLNTFKPMKNVLNGEIK